MSLRELYQEMIIDHGKHPRNCGCLSNPTAMQLGHNPLCGDELTVYLKVQENNIEEILFQGKGCAISMASASIMTETVKTKSISEVHALFERFHQLVTNGADDGADELGKLSVFAGVHEFPARVKCASLAWHTLMAALNHQATPIVSTE